MLHTKPIRSDLEHGGIVIRALSSLSHLHIEVITAAIGDGWTVQTTDDYDGYLSIIVETSEQASNKPAYLICGTVRKIELAEIYNEEMTTVLKHTDIAAIASELSYRIGSSRQQVT